MFSQKRADLTHCFRHAFARMAFADMVDQCGHSFAPHFRSNFEGNCLIGNNFGAMLIEREIDEYSCPAHGSPFGRSEEHTSELQSLMRISYAVFCLKKKNKRNNTTTD